MSQKILITGTNSGFGRLTALALARRGHTVFGTMRDISGRNRAAADELRTLAEKEGLKLHVVQMDLDNDASVESALQDVLGRSEYLDVVVNNAGYSALGLEETLTPAQLLEQLNVNVVGPHRVMRAVLPSMRARGKGYFIQISSMVGRLVFPFMGAYVASKLALEGLSDAYRYELKPTGVELTVLQPGPHPTEFRSRLTPGKDQDRAAGYGPLANGLEFMEKAFESMLTGPAAQDANAVPEALVKLIESPAGTRPGRLLVDKYNPEGITALNKAHDEVQKGLLTAMGMGNLV
ncbi:SDR family oxidoreductase [Hyalangium sp.]|uniref:SDR family oxidoreductase n=1 Tax=Hyalangium sp. TaxID=2028555 RepID=UPI002D4D70F0|nr:SDR family oxidoreductase [Hyalangium sp.]HYH99223.1 SDR family oxidoreductase [Hyalangium sp.]